MSVDLSAATDAFNAALDYKKKTEETPLNIVPIGEHEFMHIEIYTVNGKGVPQKMFVPVLLDDIQWTQPSDCNPSKLEFTVLKDGVINFAQGSKVVLKFNDTIIWSGFTMGKRRTHDAKIRCTAYDQLRYCKTKVYKNISKRNVDEVIKAVLKDFDLPVGKFDEIKKGNEVSYVCDGKEALELFDELIAQYNTRCLDLLTLYDDAGKICLRKVDNMRVTNQYFTPNEMEDWNYEASINNSYNSIAVEMFEEDGETSRGHIIREDKENINRWGLLRYTDRTTEHDKQVVTNKVENLLKILNKETRSLQLKKSVGNVQVRGGSLVAVELPLGDMNLKAWMRVKEVTHTISQDGYWMDVTVENQHLGFADPLSPEGHFEYQKKEKEVATASGAGGVGGGTNQEKIYNFLRKNGFSAAAACGAIGNFEAESGCIPNKEEIPNGYGTHGYGIAQWTNTGYNPAIGAYESPRRTKLFNWCAANNRDVKTLEAQLDYLMVEYNQTYAAYIKQRSGYDYKKITNVYTATDVWLSHFEGCSVRTDVVHWDRRINAATKYYNMWKNYDQIPTSSGGGQGSPGVTTGKWLWPLPSLPNAIIAAYDNNNTGHTHNAGDFRCPIGTRVVACDGGTVDWIQYWDGHSTWGNQSYGNCVRIRHSNGYTTLYAHLSRIVATKGPIARGQTIGDSGATGNVTGPHLHLEIYPQGAGQYQGIFPANINWQK